MTATGLAAALWYMAWWIGVVALVVTLLSAALVVAVLVRSQPIASQAEDGLKRRYAEYRKRKSA